MMLCSKNIVMMSETHNIGTSSLSIPAKNENETRDLETYNTIMHHIRDMRVLSPYHMHFLNSVPRSKLLNVIAVYNMVMRSVNEIL